MNYQMVVHDVIINYQGIIEDYIDLIGETDDPDVQARYYREMDLLLGHFQSYVRAIRKPLLTSPHPTPSSSKRRRHLRVVDGRTG